MASEKSQDEVFGAKGLESSALLHDYVQKDDLAREFDVSPRTIERWVRLRLLPPPVKIGRTQLHHVPSIRKSIEDRMERNRGHGRRR